MQLATTDPGLASSDFADQLHDFVIALLQGGFGPNLLVVRLSAQPNELACLGETQACYLPLLDDSPERFFGNLTPYSLRIASSMASNNWAFWLASLSCVSNSLMRCSGV